MNTDHIGGTIIRFTFDDGPMAGKTFEHSFGVDGMVKFRQVGDGAKPVTEKSDAKESTGAPGTKYEVGVIRENVLAVSYRTSAGHTLTAVLDFETNMLVAFASNEKMLMMQHGTFEVAESTAEPATGNGHRAHAPH